MRPHHADAVSMEALWAMRAVLWCAAGTIAVFAAAVNRCGGRQRAMLLWGGLLTYVLAFDEAARLHEEVLPDMVGFSEHLVCSFYAWLAMVWLARFRTAMPAPPAGWLIASISLFAAAIALEQVHVPQQATVVGTLKLLGVVCWGGFFARCGVQQLRSARAAGARTTSERVSGELLTLSQQEQARMSRELDATAATMAELAAMAKEAAARRSESRTASESAKEARELSGVVISRFDR